MAQPDPAASLPALANHATAFERAATRGPDLHTLSRHASNPLSPAQSTPAAAPEGPGAAAVAVVEAELLGPVASGQLPSGFLGAIAEGEAGAADGAAPAEAGGATSAGGAMHTWNDTHELQKLLLNSLQANVDLRNNQRGLETIVGKLMVGISKLEREREALKGSLDRAME